MRGRPKTFDRDEALERALEVFWQKGYAATAIGDLTSAMRIGRQSLYDTFGDKHELYLEALARYKEMRIRTTRDMLEAPGSPLANLRAFFAMWREEATEATSGCMMVNSSTEVGAVDDAAARIIEKALARLEELMREALERARDAGELSELASPRALARLIVTSANGIAARSRLGMTVEEVDDVIETLTAVVTGASQAAVAR
ncbi:MAG: TetR/AcrR family transcriptional regulator [Acidobacteriota bacterium]